MGQLETEGKQKKHTTHSAQKHNSTNKGRKGKKEGRMKEEGQNKARPTRARPTPVRH